MEVLKDKETGSAEVYFSKDEWIKICTEISENEQPILKELKDKLING